MPLRWIHSLIPWGICIIMTSLRWLSHGLVVVLVQGPGGPSVSSIGVRVTPSDVVGIQSGAVHDRVSGVIRLRSLVTRNGRSRVGGGSGAGGDPEFKRKFRPSTPRIGGQRPLRGSRWL
jgi:hypothetical protein